MTIIINPGTGPVPGATQENAAAAMVVFCDDLRAQGKTVAAIGERRAAGNDDGRFTYDVILADGETHEIEMPGLPVDQVRYLGTDEQDIWDFPRLYVDGSSWVWCYALDACQREDEEG